MKLTAFVNIINRWYRWDIWSMLFANAFYSFPGQILGVRVYVIQRLNKIVENDKKYAKSLKNKKTRQP